MMRASVEFDAEAVTSNSKTSSTRLLKSLSPGAGGAPSLHQRIGAVYDFVRNEIAYGCNEADELPASWVLADG